MISINRWSKSKVAWGNLLSDPSGQALLELAIFGMVAIGALAFLIRVGMQANFQQETRMAAFRRALAAAVADNTAPGPDRVLGTADDIIGREDARATTFHLISNRQMPNPSDGYITMPRMRNEASAFVQWGDRLTFSYMIDTDKVGDKGYGHPDLVDKNNDGRYDPVDEGQKTRQHIIVRSDEVELSFRQDHFYGMNEVITGSVPCKATPICGSGSCDCGGLTCDLSKPKNGWGVCPSTTNATILRIPSRILVLESSTINYIGTEGGEVKQTHGLGSTLPIISELKSQTFTGSTSILNVPRVDAALLNGPDGIPNTKDDLHPYITGGFDNDIKTTGDNEYGIRLKSFPKSPEINEVW